MIDTQQYSIAEQVTQEWKEIIESINIDGYSREVTSIDLFQMGKYYTGYPKIKQCYKVCFNFDNMCQPGADIKVITNGKDLPSFKPSDREQWGYKLENIFTDMFKSGNEIEKGKGGEIKFHNYKVDYMTNQGYRFVIQFYPLGILSDIRDNKLNTILNE